MFIVLCPWIAWYLLVFSLDPFFRVDYLFLCLFLPRVPWGLGVFAFYVQELIR